MITRAMKQVAGMATGELLGLAKIEEIAADYIRFRANGIDTIDAGMVIADRLTNETGIQVAVVF